MDQPWPQPQEPAQDAEDLPLAGLLAELLAASEGDASPPPENDPVAALARSPVWALTEEDQPLEAPQVLRALDGAGTPPPPSDPGDLHGMLLARLTGGDESAAGPGEAGPGEAGPAEAGPVLGALAGTEISPSEESAPQEPASAAGDLAGMMLTRLTGGDESAAGPEDSTTFVDEPGLAADEKGEPADAGAVLEAVTGTEISPSDEGAPEEPVEARAGLVRARSACPAREELPPVVDGESQSCDGIGLEETGAATHAPEPDDHEGYDILPGTAGLAGNGTPAATYGVPQSAEEPVAHAEPEPNNQDEVLTEAPSARLPEAVIVAEAPESVATRPTGRLPAVPACEDDEFELVDAAQAEKMLDRLLDAARSAISLTQVSERSETVQEQPAPAPSEPPAPGAGNTAPEAQAPADRAADRPPAAPESVGGQESSLTASRAVGSPSGAMEPAEQWLAEDRPADASPVPPAAALMALGLPERLRARLESFGDIEQILQGRSAPEAAPERKPRLLVFGAGGESYAVPMGCVREVERVGRVTPVPGAPAVVRGLVNLRGEILPLLDLAALVGRKAEPSAPRLIVAQAGPADPVVALMVEELSGLAPFSEDEIEPPQQTGPVRGSFEHRGRRVCLLDPQAVFGAEALERAAGEEPPAGLEE